jgi:hypothetical protein
MTRLGGAASVLAALALVLAAALPPGAAGTAPRSGGLSISIILPVNGSAVKGDVGIAGNASGPEGVPLSVQLSIDGGPWHAAEGNQSWTWLWSTFAFQDGLHNVTARVQGGGWDEIAAASYLVQNKKPVFVLEDLFPPGDELHLKVGDRAGFSVRVNTTGIEGFLVNWSLDGQVLQSGGGDLYNYTPRADEVGAHAVRVAVIAGGAEEASHSWNLTVRALALPPSVAGFGPGDRNFTVYLGDTVRFNVSAGDPQGRGLTYRWSYDLAPAPGNVTDSWLDLLFNATGSHVVEVVISNGETNRTVRWNVTVSEPPTIGILDVMPCMAYIIIGLILGIWYGRRTSVQRAA